MACSRVSFSSLFVFKQKTAYEMRISDWSSDVCSSDLICRWRAPQYGSPVLPQRKIRVALRSISAREDGSCHYRSWMQPLGDCARELKPLPFGCVLRMARIRSPDAFTRDIMCQFKKPSLPASLFYRSLHAPR